MQLEWLTSTPWPNSSLSSFSTPSSAICDKTLIDVDHLGFNRFKKSLIEYLAAVFLEELNADKEAWEAPAITVAREETAQQTETAVLSMQVNLPRRLRLPVIYPLIIPLLSSPLPKPRLSSTKGQFMRPPCAGKISLSQSMARAFGCPFQPISSVGV